MPSAPAPLRTCHHWPLIVLVGFVLLVAGVFASARAAHGPEAGIAGPSHSIGLPGTELACKAPRLPAHPESALAAAETSAEGDDLSTHGHSGAAGISPSVSLRMVMVATIAASGRRWRHRGQAPPLA